MIRGFRFLNIVDDTILARVPPAKAALIFPFVVRIGILYLFVVHSILVTETVAARHRLLSQQTRCVRHANRFARVGEATEVVLHTARQRRAMHFPFLLRRGGRDRLCLAVGPRPTTKRSQRCVRHWAASPRVRRIVVIVEAVNTNVAQVRRRELGIKVGGGLVRLDIRLEWRGNLFQRQRLPIDAAEEWVLLELFGVALCAETVPWVAV